METCEVDGEDKGEYTVPLWLNADFADKETDETYFECNTKTLKSNHQGVLINKNMLVDSKTSPKLYDDMYSPQFRKLEQFTQAASSNYTGRKDKTKAQNHLNSLELVQNKLFRQQKDKTEHKIMEDDQLSDSDPNSLKIKLVKMKGNERSNSTNMNNIFKYKPETEANMMSQVVKNKVNMHISVARKNDAIKKIINNLSSELNLNEKGVIDMAVKLDIRKCSLKEGSPVKKLEPMIVNIQNQNGANKNRTISEERLDSK